MAGRPPGRRRDPHSSTRRNMRPSCFRSSRRLRQGESACAPRARIAVKATGGTATGVIRIAGSVIGVASIRSIPIGSSSGAAPTAGAATAGMARKT